MRLISYQSLKDGSFICGDEVRKVRPVRIKLPTFWNKTYGISTRPNASVIHKLDTKKSCIHYYTYVTEFPEHREYQNRFKPNIQWLCGNLVGGVSTEYSNIKLLSSYETFKLINGKLYRWCKSCNNK